MFSLSCLMAMAQGWPSNWQGVMLQAFYWDSYSDSQWTYLEEQADEFAEFFRLLWIPQSGNCGSGNSMGYNDLYWFENYNSSFGNETQLRSLISTLKEKGVGTIADVVINHRSSLSGTWMSFPSETYKGVTYTMEPSDICIDDDGGKTAAQAEVAPTGAPDTGEDFDGARDLDHTSANVQTVVKAYLDFLLNDLGYTGFRYDMVKGYSPTYTILYNEAATPTYSVGECFDGDYNTLKAWVDGTSDNGVIQSAAFDFVLKYKLRDCCNAGSSWNLLSQSSLMSQANYRRYAVTFVDNHDTYGRDNDSETTANILAANAFILAAPGSPCVFLPHWKQYKTDIKQMIYARNLAGIHNQSTYDMLYNASTQYAINVAGTNGNVVIIMGNQTAPSGFSVDDFFLISSGDNFSYYLSRSVNTAWADIPSGSYDNAIDVTLSAITSSSGTKIVYTTDGSTPSASNGTQVDDGTKITIGNSMTFKAGLLINGEVSGVITRNYTVTEFTPHDITVYVKADWDTMYYHMWDSDGNGTTWPGTHITTTTTIDDILWYYNSYPISSSDYYVNFVFDQGSNVNQTVDVNNVNTDKFFEIDSSTDGSGHYYVNDVTDQHATGIRSVTSESTPTSGIYTLQGVKVDKISSKGVYIVNGRKVLVQ